ncbi:hypothetical protein BN1213_03750 [Mycobacterium tuberculosis]|uniref:Uncharacterized protein n=1 Tax=Mycobacterium tuberculosis TaxID=1773 RepID=A0A655AA49_MYCTX|nr:Uncharacterised protein [Mycobacterium tuberculosis]CFS19023.1 Uncharacterised protein [Mycobacterium tuberculosis]CKS30526.1 Uncharacterised protein [Mycobacterium tuberculosis]CNM77397.1 Uncharacterised protein [Mycobacterium tuberculosis]CNV24161.1 Uncharacterised protein [Mycobacterium tuberculosis]
MMQPFDELGQPPGQLDPIAADVIKGQRGIQPRLGILGHGHPGEDAVESEPPRVVHDGVEAIASPVRRVEAPADVRFAHPRGDGVQVVVGEPEFGAHRSGLREVEQLAGGGPGFGDGEQFGGHREQRIGLGQGAVGQTHPQPVCGVAVAGHLTEAEAGDDQRCVGVDVGAHHHDVARLQRRVVLEEAEQHLAQHIDLPRRAVTGMDLHRSVGIRQATPGGSRRVAGDVGLQPSQQRVGFGCGTKEFVGGPGGGQRALQFAHVAAQRFQQRVLGGPPAGVLPPRQQAISALEAGQRPPQLVAGVRQPQVQVVVDGQRIQQLHVGAGQAGVAEQRKPSRQVGGAVAQPGDGLVVADMRGIGPDRGHQGAPQWRLPGQVAGQLAEVAVQPSGQQPGTLACIGREQPG